MANRLSATATASGTGEVRAAGGYASLETGSLALSTVDFACAAASLAASSWPLVSIRCARPSGCSAGLGGAFLAGAFLAGAFLAGAFFAGAFLAGAFAVFLTALAGGSLAGGVGAPSGSPSGWSCGSAMRRLLYSFLALFSSALVTRVPSCQDVLRRLGYQGPVTVCAALPTLLQRRPARR